MLLTSKTPLITHSTLQRFFVAYEIVADVLRGACPSSMRRISRSRRWESVPSTRWESVPSTSRRAASLATKPP
jgi:hypothetical protein